MFYNKTRLNGREILYEILHDGVKWDDRSSTFVENIFESPLILLWTSVNIRFTIENELWDCDISGDRPRSPYLERRDP